MLKAEGTAVAREGLAGGEKRKMSHLTGAWCGTEAVVGAGTGRRGAS